MALAAARLIREPRDKTETIAIRLPKRLIAEIDERAMIDNRSRGDFLARIIIANVKKEAAHDNA
jgi:metal-responsive CopG/Arc/MetJ family transcriptional regulator